MTPNWVDVIAMPKIESFRFWRGSAVEREARAARLSRSRASRRPKQAARGPAAVGSCKSAPKAASDPPAPHALLGLEGDDADDETELGADLLEEMFAGKPASEAESLASSASDFGSEGSIFRQSDDNDDGHQPPHMGSPLSYSPSVAAADEPPEDPDQVRQLLLAESDSESKPPAAVAPEAASNPVSAPAAASVPNCAAESAPPTPGPAREPRKDVGRSRGPKSNVDLRLQFENHGEIRYNIIQKNFFAVCALHGHDCKRSRASTEAAAKNILRNPGQGRPLGLLAAWLMKGARHKDSFSHKNCMSTIARSERVDARKLLKTSPGFHEFSELERAKFSGEDSEPDDIL